MRLYRCPNNCHAANQDKRCPHCGEWLQYAGDFDPQEAHDMLLREQRERALSTGLSDWKRKTDSHTLAVKEHFKREEIKHFSKNYGN